LKSTSCSAIAQDLLDRSLAGPLPKEIPSALLEEPCGRALFGILVEGLSDRFEPALCDAYVRLFAGAVAQLVPGVDPISLVARYERIRRPYAIASKPRCVFVLSRITLGADVAVTSVLLAAAKRRFPHADIVFVAPHKNFELFAADPRIRHVPISYRRGGLAGRLSVWNDLKTAVVSDDCLVIDPDSRLTQLGLLEICADERYRFFESRAYGADSGRSLSELTAEWAAECLGVQGAKPYLALGPLPRRGHHIAVSLGTGENPAKRLPDPFEEELLKALTAIGSPLCIDLGAGGEEAERVRRAVARSGVNATLWNGSFAGFASIVAGSRLYVGYDSAGQHVAAASGVPLISIFAGFPVPRMFDRWRPTGPNATVIRVDNPNPSEALDRVRSALVNIRYPVGIPPRQTLYASNCRHLRRSRGADRCLRRC
jgi:ADP-heptose:LPS heptosyltransferase